MAGYVKKIAVIKGVKNGFSTDGGALAGLVKCEAYAGFVKIEISLVNFAPLTEGRYVFGVSDGENIITFESGVYEGEASFNPERGFAALVCFCRAGVEPVASAICGDTAAALIDIKEKIALDEAGGTAKSGESAYDDEALSEINYYELEADESGNAVCEDTPQKENGSAGGQDEKDTVADGFKDGENDLREEPEGEDLAGGLAGGKYYARKKSEIENVFSSFPEIKELERAMQGSRWAKISYEKGKHYAFGVLYYGGKARYICYGVPSADSEKPPRSLKGASTYVPVGNGGYWVLFQDADTGAGVKIDVN